MSQEEITELPESHRALVEESNSLSEEDMENLVRASRESGMMPHGVLAAGAKMALDEYEWKYIEFSHEAHANEIYRAAKYKQLEHEAAMDELPVTDDYYEHQVYEFAYDTLREGKRQNEAMASAAENWLRQNDCEIPEVTLDDQ